MRIFVPALLTLCLPLATALAYEGEEYPEQYDNQGEVYQEESYPEESYPETSYPEETYPEESYPEETMPQEPPYQDPEAAAHQQEIRSMCQQYANDMAPEEQASYIEDCMHSQGY